MEILEFQPILKRIRWGGRRLGSVLNKPIGIESDYAESWEISDHGDDQSCVIGGSYDGWTLNRLVIDKAAELFGDDVGRQQFPLLVKFLDASDRLSVQVHPNDTQARRFDPGENGKTEAWVILDADPSSRVYCGLRAGVDRSSLVEHLERDTVEECLHSFPAVRGDCIFIPAGTVHAIGEGILLAEIQQSSDLTFRLYDWGRLGSDGKPRPLHIDEALTCIDFERGPVDPAAPNVVSTDGHRIEELVHCPYFVIRRHSAAAPFEITPRGGFRIVMLLQGAVELSCGDDRRRITFGRTLLIPARADTLRVTPQGPVVMLESYLP